ncbi:hypothetical protein [Paraburkholderia caballeronis]|nr:hypothetical protein [Paraburkholderia caballeronis]
MCRLRFLPRASALAAASAAMLTVAACASSVPPDEFRRTEQKLEAARIVASLSCSTPRDCDTRWTHTRDFIDQHSATRVESADASTIETGEPHQYGVASLRAERTVSDGVTIIRLKGICRGMYDTDGGPGPLYRECAQRLYDAALDFRRSMGAAQ